CVNLENFRGDRFALLENFVGIIDASGPADVANVNESIEAVFDFDECAELQDVADFSGDDRADGIFFRREQPGIRLRLLHPERNAAVARLDVENDDVNFFADFHGFRRLHGLFCPAHFGGVNEAFDALFELDERAVIHNADNFALELAACGILLIGVDPGILHQLLEAERNALLVLIELQDHHIEFLLRLNDVGRMLDAAPAEVGEVEQAVEAANVDERAVFGDVLHGAVDG